MTNKEKYNLFCQSQQSMPVFMQPWWLDAVCAGKQWDVFLWEEPIVAQQEDTDEQLPRIVAAMPYLIRKRSFVKYILMPQQTQIGGLWIREDLHADYTLLNKLADEIVDRLKELNLWYYYQHFPISSPIPNLLKSRGFKVSERVTYRLNDLNDLDEVMNNFSKNKRRQLQKALTLRVDNEMSVEDFYRFHNVCLQEQGKKINYSREFLMVLYKKAQRLGQCQIICVSTSDSKTAAAAFLVWDKRTLYYLIPCYSPEFKDSGASALLVWEAIKLARQHGLEFDFEGSMIRGVANHYRQFGSTAVKYYSVSKYYHYSFAFALLYNRLKNR